MCNSSCGCQNSNSCECSKNSDFNVVAYLPVGTVFEIPATGYLFWKHGADEITSIETMYIRDKRGGTTEEIREGHIITLDSFKNIKVKAICGVFWNDAINQYVISSVKYLHTN